MQRPHTEYARAYRARAPFELSPCSIFRSLTAPSSGHQTAPPPHRTPHSTPSAKPPAGPPSGPHSAPPPSSVPFQQSLAHPLLCAWLKHHPANGVRCDVNDVACHGDSGRRLLQGHHHYCTCEGRGLQWERERLRVPPSGHFHRAINAMWNEGDGDAQGIRAHGHTPNRYAEMIELMARSCAKIVHAVDGSCCGRMCNVDCDTPLLGMVSMAYGGSPLLATSTCMAAHRSPTSIYVRDRDQIYTTPLHDD